MLKLPHSPAIAAAVELKPGRYPERDHMALYGEVIGKLLREWAIPPGLIDGVLAPPAFTSAHCEMFTHEKVAAMLGVTPRHAMTMSAGGATFACMVQDAALAIAAGKASAVLCVAAGKFAKMSPQTMQDFIRSTCHPELEYIYAPIVPALYAQYASRYMHDHGTTPEDMAAVSVSARKWARRCPDALMHGKDEITIEDVLSSRKIATPFHYLDCSVPCEGGGAVLVTTDAIARTLSDQPAYILGFGEYHGHGYVSQTPDLVVEGARHTGKDAFAMSGLAPPDIDHAQLYDAFTINPLIYLEDFGFAERGRAGRMFHEGRTAPGGDFPVNTNGGLIAFGHTGDSSGMTILVEGALQTLGRADGRQVAAENVLIHCYGGMMADHSTLILGRNA